jgi:VCBS repeat-containing protein
VPDAVFLLTAEFARHGHDLHLSGKSAKGAGEGRVVLEGYFAADQPADLATPRGAVIAGETVKLLAGPLAPAQYAQAGAGVAGAQPIGKITAVTGEVKVIHANGLEEAGTVNVPIFLNDVLVTAANSTVGVAFVDKATFALGANARMAIDKFVFNKDQNDTALFSVVQGAFSFVSGAVAHTKPDAMKVQLPTLTVGIRGTKAAGFAATEGEISQVTLLRNDDGTIGEIFVSNTRSGFTIATANFTAFSSSMERAFQSPALLVNLSKYQDALATLSRSGAGDRTELSPAEQALERLAQIQPGAGGNGGGGGGAPAVFTFADLGVVAVVFQDPQGNLLAVIIPLVNNDTGQDDDNAPNNQNPTIADSDVTIDEDHSVTAKVNGSDGDGDSLIYNVVTGPVFGTVSLTQSGEFTYTPGFLQQTLAVGEQRVDKFTVIAQDGRGGKATRDVFVTITGVNDTPLVNNAASDFTSDAADLTERADGSANENTGNLTDSGTIAFTDIDLSDAHIVGYAHTSSDAAPNLPGYADGTPGSARGTFVVNVTTDTTNALFGTGTVTWTFTIAAGAIDDLAQGQTITQVYYVTIDDGHGGTVNREVTVTMTGANDRPVITSAAADHAGAVTEDTGVSGGNLSAGDTIAFSDVDLIDTHTRAFAFKTSDANADLPGFTDGTSNIGTFALGAIVENNTDTSPNGSLGWTFTLANGDATLQSLAKDQTITQVYTVTITDSTISLASAGDAAVTQDVTVTITGVNDTATIVGGSTDAAGAVTEDTGVIAGEIKDSGTITFQDLDLIDTHTAAKVLKSSDANANLPGFAEGVGSGVANIGTFAIDAAVTESATDTVNTGTLGWNFTLANGDATLQSLAKDQTITQIYTVTITDNNLASVTQDVTVVITGVNDTATIVGGSTDAAGAVTEDTGVIAGEIKDSGTITFQDLDLIDTHTAAKVLKSSDANANLPGFAEGVGSGVANIGTFAIDAAVTESATDTVNTGTLGWNFTLANGDATLQSLAKDQTITQIYTVTITDNNLASVTQDVTVVITGVNDTATIVSAAENHGGALTEDATTPNLSVTKTITFQDLDLIDTHTEGFVLKSSAVNADLPGYTEGSPPGVSEFGTFSLAADVESPGDTNNQGTVDWTFTVANASVQQLAQGQVVTQIYTVTVTDNNGASVTQDVTVVITGVNDTATITSAAVDHAGAVTEDTGVSGGNLSAGDTIAFSDVDLIDTHTRAFAFKTSDANADLPGFTDGTSNIGTFALGAIVENNTDTSPNGSLGWTFTLANGDATLQSLAKDQTITQVYTVTITDSSGAGTAAVTQDVTVTITGVNDTATIVGGSTDAAGAVTEDTGVNGSGNVTDSGTITFQDLDLIDTHTVSFVFVSSDAVPNLPGFDDTAPGFDSIGTFGLGAVSESTTDTVNTGSFTWTYTLANGNATLQSLAKDQTITQIYRVTVKDNNNAEVTQDVTVTITGVNDTPDAINDTHGATLVEGDESSNGNTSIDANQNVAGNVLANDTDVDAIDTRSVVGVAAGNVAGPLSSGVGATITGTYGAVVIAADGSYTYTLDNSDADTQALSTGESVAEVFTYTIADNNGAKDTATLTVNIDGRDDTYVGTSGADTITGTGGRDTIQGLGGNDTLSGAGGNDLLQGGDNDDSLIGGAGNDTLQGGNDTDTADYSASGSGVTVDLTLATAQSGGDAAGDILSGIENVTGSGSADVLTGDGGANVLTGNGGADTIAGGGGDDTLVGGAGADSLDGGSGNDTADYSASGAAVSVDLAQTTGQGGGDAAGDVLSNIENVTGSGFGDTLNGTTGVNVISGGDGGDSIGGGAGADTLSGGSGDDVFFFNTGDAPSGETIDGGSGSDTLVVTTSTDFSSAVLVGIEKVDIADGQTATFTGDQISGQSWNIDPVGGVQTLVVNVGPSGNNVDLSALTFTGWNPAGDGDSVVVNGNANANTIVGTSQVDTLNGAGGDDTLTGLAGADTLDGGTGTNTASYAGSAAVTVTLGGSAVGGDAQGDVLTNVQNLIGSSSADTLTGDGNANVLDGSGGDDMLKGAAGADSLIGGSGTDTASYAGSAAGVTVDLTVTTGQTSAGDASGDVLSGIENLLGSSNADVLTGDGSANTLDGSGGDDTLKGAAGADSLIGGSGTDTASYAGSSAGVTVDLSVATGQTSAGDASGDVLSGIENLLGSSNADVLTGDGNANKLDGSGGDDTLAGAGGNDVLTGGAGADSLDGGANTDTADYSASASGVTVDLGAGTGSGGDAQGDVLANIENVTGSNNADTLAGNSDANTLIGNSGNDTLTGLGGADSLDGGGGNDLADYSASGSGVTVDLSSASAQSGGDAQGDVLANIENLSGSTFADTLTGDSNANSLFGNDGDDTLVGNGGADTLSGGGGNDLLLGGAGGDTLSGGAGNDTASYAGSSSGVTVSLANPSASGGDASGDSISSIENLIGSSNADTLIGDSGVNTLDGSGGDDTLYGGSGGDSLIGGSGSDTAGYGASSVGVTIDLAANTASGGEAAGDSFSGVENLIGSTGGDTLFGDSAANVIDGNDGNDWLDGRAGNDTLSGGAGSDNVYGGAGTNTLDGGADFDNLVYVDAVAGVVINLATGTASSSDRSDTISNFEGVIASSFADTITGSGNNDDLAGEGGDDTIDGGAGTDSVSYFAASGSVVVNLTTGTATGAAGNDVLSNIENARGGASADTITGSAAANFLQGNGGDDTLVGLSGADQLDGGSGNDTASYAGSAAGVTVDLTVTTGQTSAGDASGDVLSGIENLLGSSNADVLTGDGNANVLDGSGGDDTLSAGAGNDTLIGGAGADSLTGGADTDTADYSASSAGVTVDLSAGTGTGGDAQGDVLANIENVTGSGFADVLTGDGGANALNGIGGNDTLTGNGGDDTLDGGAGNDTLAGGAGSDSLTGGADTDTADYSASAAGVTVDLTVTTAQTSAGDASGDVLSSIENVLGSAGADALTGDGAANVLAGGGGNDTLTGGGGNDTLTGGAGNDAIDGGTGTDLVTFTGNFADYAFANGSLVVTDGVANRDGTDTLANVERIQFADTGVLSLVAGDDNANTLSGSTGNDLMVGLGGDDTLVGSSGNDYMVGGAGTDTADYSASSSGVTVDLTLATAQSGGSAAGDILSGIENVIGSSNADTLTGDGAANVLSGGGGNDTIVGAENDALLDGGANTDTLRVGANFTSTGNAQIVNIENVTLTAAVALDLSNQTEQFVITGSAGADTITGSSASDSISGGAGNDTIFDASAVDFLLDGGADTDTLSLGNSGNFSAASDAQVVNIEIVTLTNAITLNLSTQTEAFTITGSSGADTITGGSGADSINGGAGNDAIVGAQNDALLDGGSNTDTLQVGANFTSSSNGQIANIEIVTLTAAAALDLSNQTEGFTINGSSGVDTITGGSGADTIAGAGGADTLTGGGGTDTADYSASAAGVTVNLTAGTGLGGDAEGDTLATIENVTGSNVQDTLTGDGGVNVLDGGGNSDTLIGLDGADTLIGGAGNDFADYSASAAGVTVDLTVTGAQTSGGDASGDVLSGIEHVNGSLFDDTLTGDGADNRLTGSDGNDTLNGGGGDDTLKGGSGNDVLDGGAGNDTADFGSAVVANLTLGTAVVSASNTDTLTNIENLTGSEFADTLTGNAGVNTLNGTDGDDMLAGLGGADSLVGGNGNDTADYSASASGVKVDLNAGTGLGGDAEGDTLSGIENAKGSTSADTLTGTGSTNTLIGNGGADTLNGMDGNDKLIVADSGFAKVDGGVGTFDILDLSPVGSIDFTGLSDITTKVANVEVFDLTGGVNNTVALNFDNVLDLNVQSANVINSGVDNALLITGVGGDTVNLSGAWTKTVGGGGAGFDLYTSNDNANAKIIIDSDIAVNTGL